MGFNYGLEKKNFDSQWAVTRKQYEDAGIDDIEKAIDDIIKIYEKEKLNERKFKILELLDDSDIKEKENLEKELNDIIIKLAKIR